MGRVRNPAERCYQRTVDAVNSVLDWAFLIIIGLMLLGTALRRK